jgi:Predicted membrane protein (DUF2339)
MDSSRDSEFDARLARLEAAIAGLERSIDAIIAERGSAQSRERTTDPLYEQVQRSYSAKAAGSSRASSFPDPPIAPRRRTTTSDGIDNDLSSWFASRDPEWWLSRVGIGFLVLGVLLLYGYAIDKGWITPQIRVLAGVSVGALLFWAATRVRSHKEAADKADLGFRELLLGGGLAIWYVTAYAAAVWYQLIPIPAARLVFFLLGIVSTWIALQERREIFALVAVATGFATPFILPAPVQSMTELSLFLGAVTAMGLIIYLMRGWQSILWITFVAFWVSVAAETADAQAPRNVLDSFDSVSQWTTNPSAGVAVAIHPDSSSGHARAMRVDFDFHGNRGYAIVRRPLAMILPPNYNFSFGIKGDAPVNTLEFKLVDSAGSVWWSNNQNFQFPRVWMTITRNKWQIPRAWGQTRDYDLKKLAAVEFAITAGSGGKGSVWLDDLAITPIIPPAVDSVALAILLIAAAAAFTRVPSLRRRLVLLGSPRYTQAPVSSGSRKLMEAMNSLSRALGGGKSAPDSLIVWVLILLSVPLAIGGLGEIWPQVPDKIWDAGFVLLGVGAYAFSRRAAQTDPEMTHVALTAAVYWVMSGVGVGRLFPTPEYLPACALLAALVINSVKRQFAGPRTVAKLAIALVLMAIAGYELSSAHTGLVHLRWVVSDVVTLIAASFIARQLIAHPAEEKQGMVLGVASYLTALIVIWSALDPIWAPLVTTSYAILGAVLLILSRREGARPLLKYLGGVTMLIVVARLLLIDLSSVETIWRVLLFLVCGAVFLYTANRMRPQRQG